MVGWVAQLKLLKEDVDSFFAPKVNKATLANAMTQFRKTLPEDERELYKSIIVEREEGGIQGCRFWMRIYKAKPEVEATDSKKNSPQS